MSELQQRRPCRELPEPVVEQVADGIFAYVQPDGSWGLNNAGILVGGRSVTLVDTTFTVSRAQRLASAVGRLSPRPVRTLVNTHHHGDHTYGNFLFPEAAIIAHDRCRDAVIATGLATTASFPGVEFGDIELAPPFITFSDKLALYVDDLRVDLLAVGPPAHTNNDIVAWVPERQVLFSGDLVVHGGTPFVMMGSLSGAITGLERLRALQPSVIVPGHGPVCGAEAIDDQLEYLRFVQDLARSSFGSTSPLEAARQCDLGRFAEWSDPERLVANLHRAYSELAGDPLGGPLPYPTLFQEMVAFNGGKPLRCCA